MGKQYDDSLSAEDRQRSSIVVATLTEELSKEICLKAFIRRINEDLRRDEMMIGPELELRYFEILQKILQYNRLKLDNEYKKFDHVNNEWKPSIRNIIDALDKMSFRRVTVSMETLAKNESKRDDVVIPMLLFKEQICYLRLLLDSKEDVHHELAVAALYRLFYATSQRLDPLPRLLSEWKPNTYPKKHLEALVELVHETMKTLETASSLIKNELMSDSLLKKYKRSNKKKEMDMEQYIMACARFDVNEYFKKLASNHTVWMYSRLLYSYDINDKKVNHYIYTFMHRMWNFKLERDSTVAVLPSEANGAQVDKSNDDQAVNLGYMLFHINTLQIFSKIVNDRRVYDRDSDKFKHLIPFVSLIKMITRRLFEQSTKNRMIFVEILFQHPHAQEFCLELDSVYQAASYAVPRKEESDDSDNDNISTNKSNRNLVLEKVLESSDDSSDNYGEEFDENNISAAFLPNANDTKKKKLAKKSKKNKISKKRKLSLVDSSDSESDKEERTQSQRKSSRQARQEWSKEEDDLLRQQYSLYAGTNSIFTSIANSSEFRLVNVPFLCLAMIKYFFM